MKPKPVPALPMLKSLALPDAAAVMASREPVASVITRAVTPRLSPLIWLTTSASVCVPSVVMVVLGVPVVPGRPVLITVR